LPHSGATLLKKLQREFARRVTAVEALKKA
jgi:hypothetical protein